MKILSTKEVSALLANSIDGTKYSKRALKHIINCIHIAESRTGARLITVTGGLLQDPENQAMLMALNSREAGGFLKNLVEVLNRGSEKFMEKFFVGYGHKSIGDCGFVPLWIDGLSIVATKQFENWPLYSGQETSTRYVDVTKAGWLNPIALQKGKDDPDAKNLDLVFGKLFDFYKKALPVMDKIVRKRFPKNKKKKGETAEQHKKYLEAYNNTVFAKCCDILGAYLPCGTRTNMSIIMNIRQLGEHLQQMSFDPITEVSCLAEDCTTFLRSIYPSSFSGKVREGQGDYWKTVRKETAYYLINGSSCLGYGKYPDYEFETDVLLDPREWGWAINGRPRGCELPKEMRKFGNCKVTHLQDYRSMRDGYRHRDGTNRVPCAVIDFGFEDWYKDQMRFSEKLFKESVSVLRQIKSFYKSSIHSGKYGIREAMLNYQYLIPMGYKQPCERTITFASMVYYVELRTGTRVHPTERVLALKVAKSLKEHFPNLDLHIDESKSEWDIRRGNDVIKAK